MIFLKYTDIYSVLVIVFILSIMIYRIIHSGEKELILWIPGVLGLIFVLFIEANESILVIDKYFIGGIAFTLALISSANIVVFDTKKNLFRYYIFISIGTALFISFTDYFGGYVNSVLTKPLFLILIVISFFALVIAPIIVLVNKKANIHILWSVLGWSVIAFAGWNQWSLAAKYFALGVDKLNKSTSILILVGVVFLALYFAFVNWRFDKDKS